MKLREGQYSENFWGHEFDYIKPEKNLLKVLEKLRKKTGDSIIIKDAGREVNEHVKIYKDLEKRGKLGDKKWHEAIPWRSRHLSSFSNNLRAVDIKAIKKRDMNGKVQAYYEGEELFEFLKEIKCHKFNLGIGIGHNYCHIDIDRKQLVFWNYS